MHVYCTDGTVFECERYDVNEFGIMLYGQEEPKDQDRYDDDEPEQIGFVPHNQLWYVLPRGVTPQAGLAGVQGQPAQAQPAAGGQQTQGRPADQRQQPQGQMTGQSQAASQGQQPQGQAPGQGQQSARQANRGQQPQGRAADQSQQSQATSTSEGSQEEE